MAERRSYNFLSSDDDEANIREKMREARSKAIDLVAYLEMYDPDLFPDAVLRKNEDDWMTTTQQAYMDFKRASMAVDEFIRDENRESFDNLAKQMKLKINVFLVSFNNKVLNIVDALPAASPTLTSADLVSLCVAAASSQAVIAAPVPVTAPQAVNDFADTSVPVTATQAVTDSTVPVYADQAAAMLIDQPGSCDTATVTSAATVDLRADSTEMYEISGDTKDLMAQLTDYVKDNFALVMDYYVGDKEACDGAFSVSAAADLVADSGQWRVPGLTRCDGVSASCGQVHVSPCGATQMLLSSYDTGQSENEIFKDYIKPHIIIN